MFRDGVPQNIYFINYDPVPVPSEYKRIRSARAPTERQAHFYIKRYVQHVRQGAEESRSDGSTAAGPHSLALHRYGHVIKD